MAGFIAPIKMTPPNGVAWLPTPVKWFSSETLALTARATKMHRFPGSAPGFAAVPLHPAGTGPPFGMTWTVGGEAVCRPNEIGWRASVVAGLERANHPRSVTPLGSVPVIGPDVPVGP